MRKVSKISLLAFKWLSALGLAYVLTLIGQELLSYGLFSFIFLLVSISLAGYYFLRPYRFLAVLLVDLILVAIALLLRFYVVIAYGS